MPVSKSFSIAIKTNTYKGSPYRLFFKSNHIKMSSAQKAPTRRPLNLLRGWPNPSLLPAKAIAAAAQSALSNPSISTPGLLYGPDPGYQPLREEISKWLSKFYGGAADANRICITGGASQNLACVLQVFTDPVYTRVWMVAPCYFLACRIFDDSGLRTGAIPEGKEGIDLEYLERKIVAGEAEDGKSTVSDTLIPVSDLQFHLNSSPTGFGHMIRGEYFLALDFAHISESLDDSTCPCFMTHVIYRNSNCTSPGRRYTNTLSTVSQHSQIPLENPCHFHIDGSWFNWLASMIL